MPSWQWPIPLVCCIPFYLSMSYHDYDLPYFTQLNEALFQLKLCWKWTLLNYCVLSIIQFSNNFIQLYSCDHLFWCIISAHNVKPWLLINSMFAVLRNNDCWRYHNVHFLFYVWYVLIFLGLKWKHLVPIDKPNYQKIRGNIKF